MSTNNNYEFIFSPLLRRLVPLFSENGQNALKSYVRTWLRQYQLNSVFHGGTLTEHLQHFSIQLHIDTNHVVNSSNAYFANLQNRDLAYSHVQAVYAFLNTPSDQVPETLDSTLLSSPLKDFQSGGSCFITVGTGTDTTYSCFGSWESKPDSTTVSESLLTRVEYACKTMRTHSWGSHPPVSSETFQTFFGTSTPFFITITLIEPKQYWTKASENYQELKPNMGHVWFNTEHKNNGVTFIPSVWKNMTNKDGSYNKQRYLTALQQKQGNSRNMSLYQYNAISWTRTFDSN